MDDPDVPDVPEVPDVHEPADPPEPLRRWVHVVGALIGMTLVAGLVLLVPRVSPQTPATDPSAPPSAAGTPSLPTVPLPDPTAVPTPVPLPVPLPTAPAPTAPSITLPSLPPCAIPLGATALRVLSFNIHGGRTKTAYDVNLDRIVAEIEAWDADVVLLQEVHRFRRFSGFDDQPALLSQRLGMQVVFGRNFTRPPEGPGRPVRESGTAILSRLPILSSANQPLPRYAGQEQRGLLHVTVRVGDRDVRIYDTHFQHTSGNIRVVQARAVREIVSAAGGAFLVGGDLNATPDSRPLAVLAAISADPWSTIGPDPGLTVPARAPRRRIDYVLHGGAAWVPRQAQTLLSAISDHRAVLLDYELPAADPCGLGEQ
ncbi:MAG: endonuclease/exonuclease/phosphatase family protein [Nocardioides sp.]|nr:endonuclease/exonuclease/phosphatase family protein [Nocardioides sp.]